MISNERPSPHGYRSYSAGPPKPPVNEDTLKTEKITIERKTFIFTLKENPRGRFLRITEDVNGRRDNVIIPSTGLGRIPQSRRRNGQSGNRASRQRTNKLGPVLNLRGRRRLRGGARFARFRCPDSRGVSPKSLKIVLLPDVRSHDMDNYIEVIQDLPW